MVTVLIITMTFDFLHLALIFKEKMCFARVSLLGKVFLTATFQYQGQFGKQTSRRTNKQICPRSQTTKQTVSTQGKRKQTRLDSPVQGQAKLLTWAFKSIQTDIIANNIFKRKQEPFSNKVIQYYHKELSIQFSSMQQSRARVSFEAYLGSINFASQQQQQRTIQPLK